MNAVSEVEAELWAHDAECLANDPVVSLPHGRQPISPRRSLESGVATDFSMTRAVRAANDESRAAQPRFRFLFC
jgi:hypothetical protein